MRPQGTISNLFAKNGTTEYVEEKFNLIQAFMRIRAITWRHFDKRSSHGIYIVVFIPMLPKYCFQTENR